MHTPIRDQVNVAGTSTSLDFDPKLVALDNNRFGGNLTNDLMNEDEEAI
jgi:hypothetical protein